MTPEVAAEIFARGFALALVIASFVAERRRASLARRDAERALSLCARAVPTIFEARIGLAIATASGAAWLALWQWRALERISTFGHPRPRAAWIPGLAALACAASASGFFWPALSTRAFDLATTATFVLGWTLSVFAAVRAEATAVPRLHRERELALTVGAVVVIAAIARPFVPITIASLATSAAQVAVSTRLIGSQIRRANEEPTAHFEAVYAGGGPISSAREVLLTPLRESFLSFCEEDGRDREGAEAYREARDRETGAALDGAPKSTSRAAAAALEKHWRAFADRCDALGESRRTFAIEEEEYSSSSE